MGRSAVVLAFLAVGCGFKYQPTASSSPVEDALLSFTAKHAGAIGVRVHGEMTDTISATQRVPGQPDPTGWYQAGVAWYYRPRVAATVSLDPEPGRETANNVAAHEVCHAVSTFHDRAHWECSARVATPTYSHPATGALQAECF